MAEEKLNQKQQGNTDMPAEEVAEKANEIMDTAIEEVKNGALGDPQNGGGKQPIILGAGNGQDIGENFKGLPMRELISAPLIAAAEAQRQLASTAWDFYEKIAFHDKPDEKGHKVGDTRIVEFTVNRPVQQNGEIVMAEQKVQAPFIGLVPIPSLLIDRIDVDFQMEVTAAETSKSNFSSDVSTSISSGWFVKAEISGKVSTSRENTRSTNQTAKYQVHVSASQQPQTEGLSKLMDIMASCIEPIPTGKVEKVTPDTSGGGGQEEPSES